MTSISVAPAARKGNDSAGPRDGRYSSRGRAVNKMPGH